MICNFFQKNLQKNLVVSKKVCTFALANQKSLLHLQVARLKGEMVEWSITAVLKTAVLRGTGGSNPSLSAKSSANAGLFFFALRRDVSPTGRGFLLRFPTQASPYVAERESLSPLPKGA